MNKKSPNMCKGKQRWPFSYSLKDDRCHMGDNPNPSEVKGIYYHMRICSVVGFGLAFVQAP